MTPTMLARLKAAAAYVMAEVGKNTDAAEILAGLVKHHGAVIRDQASTNSIRCAGVAASCTWSRDKGLLKAWRKNATIKLAMES